MLNPTLKTALLGATAALALVACGSDDKDKAADTKVERPASMSSASPLDKPFTLKDAEPMDVPAFLAGFGLDQMLTYSSAEFDDKLGAAVLTDVKPAGEDQMVSVGRVEVYGLNEDAINTLKSGGSLEDMTEVFKKIRLYDLNAEFPIPDEDAWMMDEANQPEPGKGIVSIGAMEFDSLSLMSKTGEEDGMAHEGADMAEKLKSMAFGGMAMKDFLVDMSGIEGGQAVKLSASDMRVGSYSNGVFGGLFAKDFGYGIKQTDESIAETLGSMGQGAAILMNSPLKNMLFPKEQSGTIGEFRWDGMSIAGMMPYMESGEKPPVSAKDLISVGGAEFLDQEVFINGKKAATVKRTTMSPIEFYHFMPKQIKVVSEGSVADLTAYAGDEHPEITSVLKNNGLDKVEGDSSMLYKFDPKAKTIALTSNADAKGLYGFDLDLNIGSFDYDALVAEDSDGEAAMMNTTIKGMSLKLKDVKLLDTAFAVAGVMNDTDPAQLRQQAVGIVSLGALQGAQFSPRVPDYATAVSSFLSDGGTLEIKIAPSDPVALSALASAGEGGNPAAILDTLNLTVEQSK